MVRIRRYKGVAWLINLRWIAVAGVIILTYIMPLILKIEVRKLPLFCIAFALIVLNFLYVILLKRIETNPSHKPIKINYLINIQIVLDILLLTIFLHHSGGVENPLIVYYIFHMIIASILLPKKNSYILTTFILTTVGALTFLEYFEIIPHHNLEGFIEGNFYQNLRYIAGTGFIFITTSYLVVYMTNTITQKLKFREKLYKETNVLLSEKDKIKNEYVFQVTHDIKGHISTIKNLLDAASVLKDDEKKADFIQRAIKRTIKLTDFVNELLRITKLRLNYKLEMAPFNLCEAIKATESNFASFAEEKKVVLDITLSKEIGMLYGNRFLIEEAIGNIFQNAIKYTPEGGKVTLVCFTEEDKIVIEITDTGIGIPKEDLSYVFDEFYRAENVKNLEKESSGLGLALVRKIIQKHKGEIHLDSKVGKGTKVILILPGEIAGMAVK